MTKISFPHTFQPNDYTCGPTSVKMLLEFYGMQDTIDSLSRRLQCHPERGVENERIREEFLRRGFDPITRTDMSMSEVFEKLDKGYPILVNYFNTLDNVGHFAVAIGYSREKRKILLADPKLGKDYALSWHHFERHWHNHSRTLRRWAMYLR